MANSHFCLLKKKKKETDTDGKHTWTEIACWN